jgi:hypothetical protein
MSNPSALHLRLVYGILRYLFGAQDKCISMRRRPDFDPGSIITILCDADLGGNRSNSRSRTSWFAFCFGNLVGWNSRLQPSVSLSTAESEYMALAAACQFAVWYKNLLADVGLESALYSPVTILGDNQSAMKIASSPITHKYSRHIDRRLHWIKEHITSGNIRVAFVPTASNVSDIGTKALPKPTFIKLRDVLLGGFDSNSNPDLAFFTQVVDHYLDQFSQEPLLTTTEASTFTCIPSKIFSLFGFFDEHE